MSKTEKAIIIVVGVFLLALIGYALWPKSNKLGAANAPVDSTYVTGTPQYGTQDVIGTHIGTTTLGVAWATVNVTNSYISDIGSAREATYQIKVTAVTTTVNSAAFTIQGSNDNLCMTQTTVNPVTNTVMNNINWYDAMNHLAYRVEPTSLTVGSSSVMIPWNNVTINSSAEILLTNLNFRCLKFLASASSSAFYVGLNTTR